MSETITAADVLHFWFEETSAAQWWTPSAAFDRLIEQRFAALHAAAGHGELYGWRDTAVGRLAEVLVLDQFSRHLFRNRPQAFASDGMALALAQEAVARGVDRQLPPMQRAFLYLPYMHSESPAIHRLALDLYAAPGLENNLEFERRHQAIIERFGRYPHRNAALGRVSTPEEIEFLATPGSSF
ncbi:MAG TPA: DUF924 family protein [Accumulibacter sp.]|nr:DUF924 family protein [Accumulibacter sp.]HMW16674.1 DUF924 family protein [Accumulibacter sp.]HMX22687.1 DUF924 family protein [Accumulibacter sp.]HMY07139.1 DUF924 family protein [Accumulibacter sp.]HNC17683.1 DUF924 family protein [Accumulibacter sp.]